MTTRASTQVYFSRPPADHRPKFELRETKIAKSYSVKKFRPSSGIQDSQIYKMAKNFIQSNSVPATCQLTTSTKRQTSYQESINRKRRSVRLCLQAQQKPNVKVIMKNTGCSRGLIKRVQQEVRGQKEHHPYTYNNLKPREDLVSLRATIQKVPETFSTVGIVKRIHPSFSKSLILKEMHCMNLSYRKLAKEKTRTILSRHPASKVKDIVAIITQALADPNSTVLFVDEQTFPLTQTATKGWVSKERSDYPVYNQRPSEQTTITAVAMSSLEGFTSLQFFSQEINGSDFLYFINESIQRLDKSKKILVVLDQVI